MGCCIGDCCVVDCGFCCIMKFCSDSPCSYIPPEKITVDHSKKIADELAKMKKRAITPSTINPNMFFKNFMYV